METWSVLAKPNLTERAKAKAWQTYFSVSPCCKKGEAVVNLSFSTILVWHCAFQALRQQCQEWIMTMFLLWDRDSECQASLSALQRVLGISNSSTLPIQVQQINSEVWFLGQIGQTSWLCLCFIAKAYFPQQAPSSAKLSKTVYVNAEIWICVLFRLFSSSAFCHERNRHPDSEHWLQYWCAIAWALSRCGQDKLETQRSDTAWVPAICLEFSLLLGSFCFSSFTVGPSSLL